MTWLTETWLTETWAPQTGSVLAWINGDMGWTVAVFLQGTFLLAIGMLISRASSLRKLEPGLSLRIFRFQVVLVCLLPAMACLGWGLSAGSGLSASPVFQWIETVTLDGAATSHAGQIGRAETPYLRFLLLWVALGVVARWLQIANGRFQLRRLRSGAEPWQAPWVDAWCAQQGLPKKVERLLTPSASTPFTFGWLRPVIVLPYSFTHLSRNQQQAVLCHELLHVKRHDWLIANLEQVVAAIWWFHPWMKTLIRHMQLLREQAVDAAVVDRLDRRLYLETLLLFKKPKIELPAGVADTALAFQTSHLRMRVAQLTEEKNMSKSRTAITSAGLVTTLVLALTLALISFPATAGSNSSNLGTSLAGEPVHTTGEEGVVKPLRLLGKQPVYPELAKEERVEGIVIVQTVVNTIGEVEQPKILRSMGDDFDQAVLAVLPDWRFNPATKDGKAIAVRYHLTFNFRLDKGDSK